ncbi:LexA family protein [Novosphingobium rosa]|uniref:LexA family protein n=1 Tax=Novosphingobium rosa TaxID=76978 RepID=UPI00082CAC0E|nr:MarR family winged helix-turn-helix transcriptional regulator [Novosphingobium rosa]
MDETIRQQIAVVIYIRGYQRAHDGLVPTVSEIAKGLQMSRSHIHGLIDACVACGWLERLPRRARGLRVLVDLPVPTAPDGAPLHFIPVLAKPVSHGEQHG